MSLIVVHLRWDDVSPGQYEHLCRVLPERPPEPAGCLHRPRHRPGSAVLSTEVSIDEPQTSAFLSTLPELLGSAGLRDPQCAVLAAPHSFAVGYGVLPGRAHTSTPAEPALPTPRVPAEAPPTTASASL